MVYLPIRSGVLLPMGTASQVSNPGAPNHRRQDMNRGPETRWDGCRVTPAIRAVDSVGVVAPHSHY